VSKARLQRIDAVLSMRQPDLTLVLDGVHKSHNIAAIARSADAVGVTEIHMARPRAGFSRHHMISAGAQKWIRHKHYPSVTEPLAALRKQGYQIVAAHRSANAIEYHRPDYTRPTAFLMGAELYGLSPEVRDHLDIEIYIPMMGMVESLNVSVACAVLLAEAQRQRLAGGLYNSTRLPDAELAQLRFEWLYPRVAAHCRAKGLAYPSLDDEGDISTRVSVL